ncbi:H+/oligopeptide symporter [Handroanthus impetiginosus]|uniref:H+/oligopeptide symporter n=1 Tax=Handroanthus impetiginosus TaxID=429701 RepID=A0A2G9HKU9_9LAMI|nr:H+/oligopeptide symporter [Handroanthus impetiginosus]
MEEEMGNDGYTQDGTVDLKGNPILKSKTGGWTACFFVVVYEVFERMAYYGISSNLFIYLTKKLRQGTVTSANNVTNWVGTVWMTPVLGAYVADALLGRYWTFLIACGIYLSGLSLLTLSTSVHPLKPTSCPNPPGPNCKKPTILQLAVFFGALYILALGTGGIKPNISTIRADQFNEFNPKEKAQKLSFFNWWMFSIFFGTLFANTVLASPTIGLAISIIIFLAGTPFYRHKVPTGSPFTKMAKVVVATIRKWRVTIPVDPKELYELDLEVYTKKGKHQINSTSTLSVKTGSTSPWMLCSVTQVEEAKQMLRMIPILMAIIVPSAMMAQVGTPFVKQGPTLNRNIGNFKIPPSSLTGFVTLSMLISIVLYDRCFVKIIRRWTKNPRGITLLQRMGIGMIFHIVIMVVASLTERHRLNVAKANGLVENGNQVPLSIFILLPQFILMGTADAFLKAAKFEFFYDQAPENMKSLGTAYTMISVGDGSFVSSFLLSTVSHITKVYGHQGWVQNNLNTSHLDYYYGFFVILNLLNFVFFLVMVRVYVYKAEVSDSMRVLREELVASRQEVTNEEAMKK